ncbi:hypothetical protein C8J57DRAFT_1312121, partial [Mycena rebaudengoi]
RRQLRARLAQLGPTTFLNAVANTYGWWPWRRGRLDDGFHMYVLEWNEQFIRAYVDSRLHYVHARDQAQQTLLGARRLPERGAEREREHHSGEPVANGTKAAPFDQSFYL